MNIFKLLPLTMLFACAFSPPVFVSEISDHFDGNRFFNPGVKDKEFSDVIDWWWQREPAKWPKEITVTQKKVMIVSDFALSFVGHSTFLIQVDGINILTDPIWSDRASPFSFIGPKRVRRPGIKFEDLPKVDVVMVSHNHYDHMDIETLKKLEEKFKPLVLTGLGNKKYLENYGLKNVRELDWGGSFEQFGMTFIFSKAQHFSARGLTDRNKTLWGAFVVKTPRGNIYFAGDTGYADHFKEVGMKYGPFQLAMIPIGAYDPRWFMKTHHTDPKEAVMAHIDLKSKYTVGMHFGTFQLTDEAVDQPLIDLSLALKELNIPITEFETLDFGQTKHLAPL